MKYGVKWERREPKGSVTPKQGARHRKRKMLGEGEAGESKRQKRFDLKQKLTGLRRNSGECMIVPREKNETEFGVKFVQTQTKNGSLLFNMTESLSMYCNIDKIKTVYIYIYIYSE